MRRRNFIQSTALMTATVGTGLAGILSTNSSVQGQETPTIRLGLDQWLGYLPWRIAEEKNMFANHGIKGQITWFPGITEWQNAFNTNNVDVMCAYTGDVITSNIRGVKCKVVAMMNYSNGGDQILAADSIKTIADFKDKEILVKKGTIYELLLLQALDKNGLTPSDVKIVDTPGDVAGVAFGTGKADIVVTGNPGAAKALEARKSGRVIFSSSDVPGMIPDLITVHSNFIDKNPKVVQGLVDTWFEAVSFHQKNTEEAYAIEAKFIKVPVDQFKEMIQGIRFLAPPENMQSFDPNDKSLSLYHYVPIISQFLLENKVIDAGIAKADDVLDGQFVADYFKRNPA
ncbi:MAG: ABC transporter substrate-binding protein [Synechococcales cyanobacterium]